MKHVILISIAVFIISFGVSFLPRYINQQNTIQELGNVRSEQQIEAKRRLREHEYRNKSALPAMSSQVDEIERLKNSVGGENAVILEVTSEIIREMILITSQLEDADKEASTVFEFGSLSTLEDIDNSIEKVERAEQAANTMDQAVREMGPKLKEALTMRNVSPADIDSAMQGFYRTADIERKSESYKMSVEIWKEVKVLLHILEREWGAWEYDEVDGGVLFDSDNAIIEWNNTMDRIDDLALKTEELQLAILRRQAGEEN